MTRQDLEDLIEHAIDLLNVMDADPEAEDGFDGEEGAEGEVRFQPANLCELRA